MDYSIGMVLETVGDPEGLAAWCTENEAVAVACEKGWEIVAAPMVTGKLPSDPAPTRGELADAVAEIGDMVASQDATNEMILDALAELGDAVAALEEKGA